LTLQPLLPILCRMEQRSEKKLGEAAEIAARDVLGIREGEKVVIVTNPGGDVSAVSTALYDAAAALSARPVLIFQPVKTQLDFTEPAVIEAIRSGPDVFISMSSEKLGKDEQAIRDPIVHGGVPYTHIFHYYLYGTKSVRAFWSPGITADLFSRTVPVDYRRMKTECAAVARVFDWADSVAVTNPKGTDISFSIRGRKGMKDDGDFTLPGSGGNLPAGEGFVSPVVGTAEGVIVFDGSIAVYNGVIVIKEPITVRVREGFVTEISGGTEADELRETIEKAREKAVALEKEGKIPEGSGEMYARNAGNIGELGVGLNPAAEIVGNMLVDEKVYRTCHIAIGSNYDEDAKALIHLDGLITAPTIQAFGPGGREQYVTEAGELTAVPMSRTMRL
jgi:aminopeptidase